MYLLLTPHQDQKFIFSHLILFAEDTVFNEKKLAK